MQQILSFIFTFFVALAAQAQACNGIFSWQGMSGDPYSALVASFSLKEAFGEDSFTQLLEMAGENAALEPAIKDYGAHQNSERHRTLAANARAAIQSRGDDQLVIVHQGIRHTYELYNELGPRADVSYLMPDASAIQRYELFDLMMELSSRTPLDEVQALEIQKLMLLAVTRVHGNIHREWFKFVVDLALKKDRDQFEAYLNYMIQSIAISAGVYHQQTRAALTKLNQINDINAIVIGDIHFMPTVEHIHRLPAASQLQARGIHEVLLYIEGVRSSQTLEPHQLLEVTALSIDKAKDIVDNWSVVDEMLRGDPVLDQMYQGLRRTVVTDPAAQALIEYIQKEYIAKGIRVQLKGLEKG